MLRLRRRVQLHDVRLRHTPVEQLLAIVRKRPELVAKLKLLNPRLHRQIRLLQVHAVPTPHVHPRKP